MERKFIDLRITAISDEDLKDFMIALRKIQYCGDVGANRLLPIQIDGDVDGDWEYPETIASRALEKLAKIDGF